MNNSFKADIDKTFFTDFAEKIDLSGIKLKAVITKVQNNPKMTGKFKESLDSSILVRNGLKVSIKTRDLPSSISIEVGENITIDDVSYYVYDVEKRRGMIHIYVQKYEG